MVIVVQRMWNEEPIMNMLSRSEGTVKSQKVDFEMSYFDDD